jgi:CRP-like cAMP-binding protein
MTSPLLRPDEWLKMQPADFRERLATIGTRRVLPARTFLYRVEDWGGIYGVVSGCLEVIVELNSGQRALNFAYPGYFIGNRPIKLDLPYAVSVAARLDSKVTSIPFSAMTRMVEEKPEWWKGFATLTDYWFDVAICGWTDLMLRNSEARCMAVLLRLGGYRPFTELDDGQRLIPVTQQELGENTNLSRSRVSEILAELEKAELIARSYGGIRICEPAKMQKRLDVLTAEAEKRGGI